MRNSNIIKKPELLAPAGNLEKLKYAIHYGADAVYIGGRNYSLRANNDNFTISEIKEACLYAHKHNARVYVTVNIIFHSEDVEGLKEYLIDLEQCGVDAVIVSDPLVIELLKEIDSKMEIHISTQQSTLNYEAASFWKDEGVTRIVLAREASGTDIKEIIDKTGIETEIFIHGAMCSGFSGRCVLSNHLTARDSNRGGCSQICRWNFTLRDDEELDVSDDSNYAIAPKDLSMLKYIPSLIDIGVRSFKIEGRMRSIYYIATMLHTYRKVIDEYCNNKDGYEYNKNYEKILFRCANRDAVPQFFEHRAGFDEQYYTGREEVSNQDFLGIVLDYDEEAQEVVIEQRNFFKVGDEAEIFGPNIDTHFFKIEYIKDNKGNLIDAARHPKQVVRLPINKKVEKYDLMRIKLIG
ncbi:MAG TPA: U32 family peptidase [Mollicutes bacterium]|nr:U32 family peptidase [Mollicutes bacterium]